MIVASILLPFAWLEYCGRTQEAGCRLDSVAVYDVAVVNTVINYGIEPKDDEQGHDSWDAFPADRKGDCDDYVVSKRQALLALGVEPKRLRIVAGIANRPDGKSEKHIVLEWTDDKGYPWVLDNLDPDSIYEPGKGPYEFVETGRQTSSGAVWSEPEDVKY